MIKSTYHVNINVGQEMRLEVANLIPRFEEMCCDQQAPTFCYYVTVIFK